MVVLEGGRHRVVETYETQPGVTQPNPGSRGQGSHGDPILVGVFEHTVNAAEIFRAKAARFIRRNSRVVGTDVGVGHDHVIVVSAADMNRQAGDFDPLGDVARVIQYLEETQGLRVD